MKYTTIIFASLLLVSQTLFGQNAHFTTSGTVEFSKSVNMYAVMKNQLNSYNLDLQALDSYKKNNPQFKTLKSTLSFANNKTLFTPDEPEANPQSMFGGNPLVVQNNVIFSDFGTNISTTEKSVFDETFLIKDTTRKINWKITDETREIAGYTCRRANAIMLDSIYVVAFYTIEIPVSGGPESFSGLPGMILGVALPHESITWFATKVTDTTLPDKAVSPPKKGKPTDNKGFRTTLESAFKDWGSYAKNYFKAFML